MARSGGNRMNDDVVLDFQAQTANRIFAKLSAVRRNEPVTEAIELLLRRIVGAGNSLRVLHEHAPHEFAFDGAMILRGIYEAMLQALYILQKQSQRIERATLYLDFYWVEHKQFVRLIDTNPTYLANKLSQSSKRAMVEPAIEQKFESVRGKFENDKGKLRNHWYPASLREIASAIGRESEYEFLQKQLSGAVHSSAFSLKNGVPYERFLLIELAWRFSFRVLGRFAEYAQIE